MSKTNDAKSLAAQIAELDELTQWFEQDDFDIEQAIKKYERACEVAAAVNQKLTKLENHISILKQRFDTDD